MLTSKFYKQDIQVKDITQKKKELFWHFPRGIKGNHGKTLIRAANSFTKTISIYTNFFFSSQLKIKGIS